MTAVRSEAILGRVTDRAIAYLVAAGVLFAVWLRWLTAGRGVSARWAAYWVRMFQTAGSDRTEYNTDAQQWASVATRRLLFVGLPMLVVLFTAAGITYLLR